MAEERETAGQDSQQRTLRARQMKELEGGERNAQSGIGTIPIDVAMKLVASEGNDSAVASLVPAVGAHDKPTVPAVWGRPPDDAKPPTDETPTDAPSDGAATNGEPTEGATDPATPPTDPTPPPGDTPNPPTP